MIRYIGKRLLQAIPLLLGIAAITFIVIHAAPGDPIDVLLQPRFQQQLDPAVIEAIRARYGLDQPIYVQFWHWLTNLAQGNLGRSFHFDQSVASLLAERLPYTLQLMGLALVFDAVVGIGLGVVSAVKKYSTVDATVTLGSLIVYSIPGFWLAVMLVLVFAENLGWLPPSGTQSIRAQGLAFGAQLTDRLRHLMLPVFVLGVSSAAATARYVRSELLEVLSEEFVLAARARGIGERAIILKHALRNALIPVVTKFGLSLSMLLGGAVLIEYVFDWPGMGSLAVEAVSSRDVPVILATTVLSAALVVVGNLLADVAYAALDPRVSYGEGRGRGV